MISITIIVLLFLVLGCIGSKTESQNGSTGDAVQPMKTLADKESDSSSVITPTPTPDVTPTPTPDVTPTPTPDVTPTPTQPVYQDAAWGQYILRCAPLIGTDLTNAGSAGENLDFTTLGIDGQNIIDDTQRALDENDQYSISPKE